MDGTGDTCEATQPNPGSAVDASLDLELTTSLDSPKVARGALTAFEDRVGHTALAKARLALTELVANSVKHAEGDSIGVKVRLRDGRLRAEVADGGDGFEPPSEDGNLVRTQGWGLVIVRRLADRWGISDAGVVWFEIDYV